MKRIPDLLWCEIEKLIPAKKTGVGRPEFDNKKTFEGIVYILRTGAQWCELPSKYGCFTTVHGKYMKWIRAGFFQRMMVKAREYYRKRNKKNIWFAIDTASKKAPFAKFGGKSSTDRAKRGIKHILIIDRKGVPLFAEVAPGNRHDSKLLQPVLKVFRKSKKVRILAADSAWDNKDARFLCKQKNIALIASPNKRRNKNIVKFNVPNRWVVERTFGILSWFRGLKICWSKTKKSALALLQLACSLRIFKTLGIFG